MKNRVQGLCSEKPIETMVEAHTVAHGAFSSQSGLDLSEELDPDAEAVIDASSSQEQPVSASQVSQGTTVVDPKSYSLDTEELTRTARQNRVQLHDLVRILQRGELYLHLFPCITDDPEMR